MINWTVADLVCFGSHPDKLLPYKQFVEKYEGKPAYNQNLVDFCRANRLPWMLAYGATPSGYSAIVHFEGVPGATQFLDRADFNWYDATLFSASPLQPPEGIQPDAAILTPASQIEYIQTQRNAHPSAAVAYPQAT